jgi:alpha-tubulin suppressor-like RCC1 family protein
MSNPRNPLTSIGLMAVLLLPTACGDGADVPTGPTTGSIQITVTTTGSPADPDGFTAVLDPGATSPTSQTIPAAGGSATFSEVAAGAHTVELQGLADNCVASPATSQQVTVIAAQAATVTYSVACSTPPPPPVAFSGVTAGQTHTCALLSDGRAFCWGSNGSGELGSGSGTSLDSVPEAVSGGLLFQSLSANLGFTCGVSDGAGYCWGRNDLGQLGDGTQDVNRAVPTPIVGGLTFQLVSAGGAGACGVTESNHAYCWGLNTTGQRGTPFQNGPEPDSVVTDQTFDSLEIGGDHTCGLTPEGVAFCWGANGNGQLGNGAPPLGKGTPVAVVGGLTFRTITVATLGAHTCGLTPDNVAYCWGANDRGQLGDGTTDDHSEPTAVAGGLTFTDIDAGGSHTCAVATGGQAYCWGYNNAGQLGNGTGGSLTDESSTPVAVSGGLTFAQISAGFIHSCGVTTDGKAWCWGNGGGLLGNNSTSGSLEPVEVVTPSATP